jgi:secreted trypsin-like serine protease
MRRALASLLPLLAALLALTPTASAMSGSPRVVGGTTASSTDAPWQALVLIRVDASTAYLCGGSILDATHIVTAAHCIYDDGSYSVYAPSTVTIKAGVTDRTSGTARLVSAIAIDPDYSPEAQTNDAAILTLTSALTLNTTTMTAIGLSDVGWRPTTTDDLRLSGWGLTTARAPGDPVPTDATLPTMLQVAKTVHATDACSTVAEYQPYDDDALLCAGQAGLDACQGDSGGPLAFNDAGAWKLAGIVTGGAGCAWAGYPGYYARVSYQPIHDFLLNRGVGYSLSAPYFTTQPSISGTPQPGNTLTCNRGQYANAYTSNVDWYANGTWITDDDTLNLLTTDVGASINCVVTAVGLRGSVQAASGSVVVQPRPAATPAPAVTNPTPTPVPAPAPAGDAVAPTVQVVKVRCSRTICILDLKVVDPAPSSGIKGVEGKVSTLYRTTCTVKGQRRRCTKKAVQRLTARSTGTNTYRITTPRMRKGTHTFTLIGVDAHGNRQVKPTTLKRTTR